MATATREVTKGIRYTETQEYYEWITVPIVGTAAVLMARALPWDIGGAFWEQFDQAIQSAKNPALVLGTEDRQLLKRLGFEVNGALSPEANAHLRAHWLPDLRLGYPVGGFNGAVRTAAVQYKGKGRDALTAKTVGGAMSIFGDESDPNLVALNGNRVIAGGQMGKSSGIGGAPRIITRMKLTLPWDAELRVRYVPQLINAQQVVQLIAWAGDWGIGQWRPSSPKGGTFGTWRVRE